MGILQKLKSVLGMDGPARPGARSEPDVTVEREPSTSTEQAVKEGGPSDAPRAPRSAGASTGETEPESAETSGEAAASVEEINGIGPTYAERLADAGIETVADLADSDVETVAEAAQANESRVADWLEQARDR